LATAFWIYLILFVHVGGGITLTIWGEVSPETIGAGIMLAFIFLLFVWVAVYQASSFYLGRPLWRTLARLYVVMDAVVSLVVVIAYFSLISA